MAKLKIATFNINGIRARLPILLQWLEKEAPDIVCLQELKAADTAFPADDIRNAGYGDLAGRAVMERRGDSVPGQ